MTAVSGQDMIDAVLHPTLEACNNAKIDLASLLKDLKKELKAKETKYIKVKKGVTAKDTDKKTPKKAKIIYETSEEVLLAIDMINWTARQAARKDAHMLRGDYPAKNVEVTGKGGGPVDMNVRYTVGKQLLEEVDGATRGLPGRGHREPAEG